MRYSKTFAKSTKTAPADAESVNAKFLLQGGFVHQEMAGVYSWLPLGLRVLRKVENIVREEMNELGGQEIFMTALQPKENWVRTERWDSVDVLFKIPSQTGKEYALGPTAEDIVTPLVQSFVNSYKDFPLAVYQIQTKFRDELRAKSGVLRGREFLMKDMYSFHTSREDFEAFYERAKLAYLTTYSRCGLNAKITESSGGSFSKKASHEFQIETPAGEDSIVMCRSCHFAQNTEIATTKDGDACPECGATLVMTKGIEVGNIFDLTDRFSKAFDFTVTDENGEVKPIIMGCYGIGVSRLVGTIVEASHDDKGIIWPKSVAPFHVHLVSLSSKKPEVAERVQAEAKRLYDELQDAGLEVMWDDREGVSAGEKFANADLIGLPLRLVVSEKTLTAETIEWKERTATEATMVPVADVISEAERWLKND
ncbi:MAG: His/Gly/Thr/Pro-type tRNA ligase C-terminal domain-containing protein [Candidatus Uhrbacteria bacterium]|nr:His/Gly/Thr/Pro-type tRNA ligase C-terminal domain-containing protein [Candidatus Uhrbacteria bacterium]